MDNLEKYLPNAVLLEEFEQFRKLQTEEEKKAFQQERLAKMERMSEEDRKQYLADSKNGLETTLSSCRDAISRADEMILKEKLGELPEIISFSYIAKKYFGKSRNWLYQRINGYNVNGKQAKFSPKEYEIFLNALEEISQNIKQTSASLRFN